MLCLRKKGGAALEFLFDKLACGYISSETHHAKRPFLLVKKHLPVGSQPVNSSIRPNDAILDRDVASFLRVPERVYHEGPIVRVDQSFPAFVGSLKRSGSETVQLFLMRRPGVDVFLNVPLESHRARRFLREVEQVLLRLQLLECALQLAIVFGGLFRCSRHVIRMRELSGKCP